MYKVCLTLLIFIILFPLFLTGCQKSKLQDLEERLDAFRNILPQDLRDEFDSGNYEVVVLGIDSLFHADEEFKIRYEQMKDRELINVFTPDEVVDFFKTYFVEEIEKEKKFKD